MILIGELVPFALAVIALLLLIGAWLLFQPVKKALNRAPIPFIKLGDYIDAFLGAAIQAVEKDLDLMLVATGRVVWAVGGKVWGWVYQVTQGIAHAGALASHALAVAYQTAAGIPAQIAAAVGAALVTAQGMAAYAIGVAEGLYDRALAAAQADAAYAIGVAEGLYDRAEADIATVASDVISEANRVLGQAEAAAGAAVQTVEAEISGLAGQVQGLEDQVGGLSGALGLLATIPLLNSLVQSLTTEADTCLKPLCDTVTPNAPQLGKLGQFLQGLETLGVDVLVAGLFAEAVTNPAGLAHETVTLVEDVGGPVITGIRDLTGL